jgi:O-antigen ligase
MMPSVAPYLSDAYRDQASLPHMHNEVLNFAVFGGVVGIALYLTLLALPILACLRTPRDSLFRARMYGCCLLTLGYFMLGLPDTMLSFEVHTALYVAWLAVLLNACRDSTAVETPNPKAR